jgi:predicted DNA-binding antitoxin AbrB/MazE fold protein
MISLNVLAKKVTLKEGKKKQVSIAQVKEILRITFKLLGKHKASEVMQVVEKYKKK